MFSFNSKLFSLVWYIVVFGTSSYCLVNAAKVENASKKRMCLLLAVLLPALVSAFRLCGTDLGMNLFVYNRTKTVSWYELFMSDERPAYYLLMKVGYLLGGYQSFLFLVALIPCAFVCKTLYDSRGKVCLGLAYSTFLFGCLTTSWNVSRQYIAVGITCFAVRYVFSRKLWKFVLCVFVAYLFHPSCVVMLAVYPLWTKEQKLPEGWKLFLYYVMAIVFIVGLGSLVSSLPGELGEEYNTYLSGNGSGKNRDFLVNLLWLSIFLYYRERLRTVNPQNEYYLALFGLVCVIGLSGYFSPFIKRVAFYFSVFRCFLIGSLPLRASGIRSIQPKEEFHRSSSRISKIRQGAKRKETRGIPLGISKERQDTKKKESREIPFGNSFLCSSSVWLTLYLAVVGLFVLVAYILGQAEVIPYRASVWKTIIYEE